MSHLIRTLIESGNARKLYKKAATGDIISLADILRTQGEIAGLRHPCCNGVIEYRPGFGFYTNGNLTHRFETEVIDFYPYGRGQIIVRGKHETLFVVRSNTSKSSGKLIGEIDNDGSLEHHPFTDQLLHRTGSYEGKDYEYSLIVNPTGLRKINMFQRFLSRNTVRLCSSEKFLQTHLGHPEGPVILEKDNDASVFKLWTPKTSQIIHSTKRTSIPFNSWIACKKGIVFLDSDELCFNENRKETFFNGFDQQDTVLATPVSCAVIRPLGEFHKKIFLPGHENSFDFLGTDLVPHPWGILADYGGKFLLFVIKD